VTLPDSGRVEVTDSFFPSARGLNGNGDSIAATVYWASLDTAFLAVLDSTTGVSLGVSIGTGRLQARVDELRSNPQPVTIMARLDAMAAASPLDDTLDTTPANGTLDSLSNPLKIQTTAFGGNAVNRRVVYGLTIYPASGPVVTLVPNDTVATSADGSASVQVKVGLGAATLPDSVVVTAAMQKFHGGPLPGSPVTFVVRVVP
jgi:hypothetical protein